MRADGNGGGQSWLCWPDGAQYIHCVITLAANIDLRAIVKRANGQWIVGCPVKGIAKRVAADLFARACLNDDDTAETIVRVFARRMLIRDVEITVVIQTNARR